MNTKLTLTIERTVIEQAKLYAKEKGRSLSDIVENYLKIITKEQEFEEELSPLIKSLQGSFKLKDDIDYFTLLIGGDKIQNSSYKDEKFVKNEIEKIVEQLGELK